MTASTQQTWPERLWIVRHGESAGNVARDAAMAAGLPMIDIALRDADVPLSPLGERQSTAVGRWFGARPEHERPTVVLSSPFVRAAATADLIVAAAQLGPEGATECVYDERLREKEFGSLDRFTRVGIVAQFPHEAELRARVGKFYYRPPGGESWCDVVLRLRSLLDSIQLQYAGERVLIVGHQVIVLCFRYLLERMTEPQILAIDHQGEVANCSVTAYELEHDAKGRGQLGLRAYNFVAPVEAAGERVTQEPSPSR